MEKFTGYRNNVLLFISSIIFFFILAELGKRAYDRIFYHRDFFNYIYDVYEKMDNAYIRSEKGNRNRPHANYTYFNKYNRNDINIRINSLGFRDDELHKREENEFRILVLGDSITIGYHLDKEDVYVEHLEKQLNNSSGKIEFQVVNAGVRDIGLAQEVDILRDNVVKVQPDLVGIGFYLNDSRAPWAFHVEKDFLYNIAKHSRFLNWLWRQIYLEKYILKVGKERFTWIATFKQRKWVDNKEMFYRMIDEAESDWGVSWRGDSWEIIRKKLDEILNLGKKHNFKTFLFCFPVSIQVESEIFDNKPQQILKKICYDKNIPFLDLLPVLRNNKDKDLFFDQCHLKPVGNIIVADAILGFLQKDSLIPNQPQ